MSANLNQTPVQNAIEQMTGQVTKPAVGAPPAEVLTVEAALIAEVATVEGFTPHDVAVTGFIPENDEERAKWAKLDAALSQSVRAVQLDNDVIIARRGQQSFAKDKTAQAAEVKARSVIMGLGCSIEVMQDALAHFNANMYTLAKVDMPQGGGKKALREPSSNRMALMLVAALVAHFGLNAKDIAKPAQVPGTFDNVSAWRKAMTQPATKTISRLIGTAQAEADANKAEAKPEDVATAFGTSLAKLTTLKDWTPEDAKDARFVEFCRHAFDGFNAQRRKMLEDAGRGDATKRISDAEAKAAKAEEEKAAMLAMLEQMKADMEKMKAAQSAPKKTGKKA
jgi:hypothetical protein